MSKQITDIEKLELLKAQRDLIMLQRDGHQAALRYREIEAATAKAFGEYDLIKKKITDRVGPFNEDSFELAASQTPEPDGGQINAG